MRRYCHALAACVAACLLGCAAELSAEDPLGGDSADDLIGRPLVIETGAAISNTSYPADRLVEPTVHELEDKVVVRTDDLRIGPLGQGGVEIFIHHPDTQQTATGYGFRVEMLEAATATWREIRPPDHIVAPADRGWFWESFSIQSDWNIGFRKITLAGRVVKQQDQAGGLSSDVQRRDIATYQPEIGEKPNLRVLVLPAWNFWDWDEEGYAVNLRFNAINTPGE